MAEKVLKVGLKPALYLNRRQSMANKNAEAIKLIKEDIRDCETGIKEGYIIVGLGLSGEKVDNKKAVPQLKEILKMVEEENGTGYLFNEKSENLVKGMQMEIDKLKKKLKEKKC